MNESNRLSGLEQGRADRLRQELAHVERQLERLIDSIAEGDAIRSIKERMVKLEQRRDAL